MDILPSSTPVKDSRGGKNVSTIHVRVTRDAASGRKDVVVVDGKNNDTDEDLDILRKEYRNMQANRNAFAHESDRVSFFEPDQMKRVRREFA